MELAEFVEETGRIEKFFEKELTKFQAEEWYKELQNMPIKRYRQIVRQIYRECKFMPKLADIIKIDNELPYNLSNTEIKEKVYCEKCKGEGIIKYFKEVDNGGEKIKYEYFARCTCQNGETFNYDGTTISDDKHKSKFYIPSIAQLGL